MAESDSQTVERIFEQAVAHTTPAEREAFLSGACANNAALRDRVQALLQAHDGAGNFLGQPATSPDKTVASPLTEGPGTVIDKYRLLQLIGEGGFGAVYLAEQKEPVKRKVALKIIKLGMDTKQVIARFEAERQALAMMDHPNIAHVLDAGATETGRPYFVMEYVRGVGIIEYCDKEKLDTDARLELFIKVCQAIQHAHQKGIIHRDIKPSNVMVTLHDGVPVPKVIDFGVAKATNTELTQRTLFTEHRQLIGTPAYMSPEQAEMSGLDIDTRTDIYSLGVLLYELLTGTTPFDTKSLMEIGFAEMVRVIREQEPAKPSTRLSFLGDTALRTAELRRTDVKRLGILLRGDLDWIVMKCLEKDRTRRYETANGLAKDIERHLKDEPVVAGPPSASYRLRKYLHRNRTAVSIAATVAVCLIAGLSVSVYSMLEAWKQRDAAQAAALREQEAKERLADERSRLQDYKERADRWEKTVKRTIAVLPFENVSGDPEQDFFATGLTAALTSELGKIEGVEVRPMESVAEVYESDRAIAEIAKTLNVDYLIRGSVRRTGDEVQITMRLVHKSESQLWSGVYDDSVDNIANLKRGLSKEIMDAVLVQVSGSDEARLARADTSSPAAREAYFKGTYNMYTPTKQDLRRAIEFFDEAIAFDPEYALAHATKAHAYLDLVMMKEVPDDIMPKAREAALRAIEIDDSLSTAWVALGDVLLYYDYDWDEAGAAFHRALELDPDLADAHIGLAAYFVTVGDFDRSVEHLREGVRIDPTTLVRSDSHGFIPFAARKYDVAIEFCKLAIDMDDSYWAPHATLGLSMAFNGDIKGGLAEAEKAYQLAPEDPMNLALLAFVYAMDGQRAEALARVDELLTVAKAQFVCPYEIATVYIALGDHDLAFEWLDRAVESRSPCIPFMGADPRMDPLRPQEHFDDLMREVDHPLYGQPMPWLTQPRHPRAPADLPADRL